MVVVGVVAAELVEGRVDDLDGERAALDLDDGGVVEGGAEGGGVDRGGRDDDLQLGAFVAERAEVAEEEVDVERALVGLVDDDGVVFAEERVALDLGEEHAVGEEFDDGVAGCAVIEADLAADLAAPGDVEFVGDAAGDGQGGDPARLGAGDAALGAAAGGEAEFGDLGGFAGAGFAGENEDGVILKSGGDFLGARGDGEFGRELEAEGKGIGGRTWHEIWVCHSG